MLKKPGPAATGKLSGLTTRGSTRVLEQTISESNNNIETTRGAGPSNGTKKTFNDGIVSLVNATAGHAASTIPVVKRHRTAKAVHSIMLRKYHNKEAIKLAYIAPTKQIMYQRHNVPKKERCNSILNTYYYYYC